MITAQQLYRKGKDELTKAGIEAPAFNSLCFIEKTLSLDRQALIARGGEEVDPAKVGEFFALVSRRAQGEPLQYIMGEWEFYGCRFKVGRGVLIPRDDTEVLLRVCLEILKDKPGARVLDLCSGSGALAVAIAKKTRACVTAVEKSPEAIRYLKENTALNGVAADIRQGDIFTCSCGLEDAGFDLILSNPPYIKREEIKNLQREISFEPTMALDGGEDGFDFYRCIVKEWKRKLKSGGTLALELGEGQFETVKKLMEEQGFENIRGHLDLGGVLRAINGTLIKK